MCDLSVEASNPTSQIANHIVWNEVLGQIEANICERSLLS